MVTDALHYVLGQAINHRDATKREGRRENLEHFYTLFSFSNLDSLRSKLRRRSCRLVPCLKAAFGATPQPCDELIS